MVAVDQVECEDGPHGAVLILVVMEYGLRLLIRLFFYYCVHAWNVDFAGFVVSG